MTRHNTSEIFINPVAVVNCFQKLLSSWHDTTLYSNMHISTKLWIAFKNYYLRDTTQPSFFVLKWLICCELLSKIIIFVTRHNSKLQKALVSSVVNCFQKLLSSWHDTTVQANEQKMLQLWIAFKNYYLRDTTQPRPSGFVPPSCCELLSKIIIFVTRHNRTKFIQFINPLWIAFKNYYLRDTTQQQLDSAYLVGCCELLSKIIIFVTRHNITS